MCRERLRRIQKRAEESLGDAWLEGMVGGPVAVADAGGELRSIITHRPVVVVWVLANATADEAGEDGGHELMELLGLLMRYERKDRNEKAKDIVACLHMAQRTDEDSPATIESCRALHAIPSDS